ncbi:Nitrogen permease reactivator protein [Bulinus truncatus]|nr:Nitrogen permease reactivator protein [Bulinus truncatus]
METVGMLLMLMFVFWTFPVAAVVSKESVMIAALLPVDNRPFSIYRIAPALEIAIEKVRAPNGYLPGRKIQVNYGDSNCSSAESMNEAINLFVSKKAHVFLGPTCAYALAPIVRQARFWKVPILSPTFAIDFMVEKKTEYPMLTLIGANLLQLSETFDKMLQHYKWNKLKTLYNPDDSEHFVKMCHLYTDSLDKYFNKHGRPMQYFKFERTSTLLNAMDREIGTENGADPLPLDSESNYILAQCFLHKLVISA